MDVVTPSQMKRIDQRAIEEFRIPGIVLMENAALQTAQVILKHDFLASVSKKPRKALILAGCGNNGGDGFAIARHLFLYGYQVSVLIVSEGGRRPGGDAETNLDALYALQNVKTAPSKIREKDSQQKNLDAFLQIHWLEKEGSQADKGHAANAAWSLMLYLAQPGQAGCRFECSGHQCG